MRADTRTSLDSTAQHIALIDQRLRRLSALRWQAIDQMLARIGSEYRTGDLTLDDMIALYEEMRALRVPADRWAAATGLAHREIYREKCRRAASVRHTPNGPEGSWYGTWPMPTDDPRPGKGTPVVYVLFDAANQPCYVGSTADFRTRLKQHAKTKAFAAWTAQPCEDREHAYAVEDVALKRHKPPMNGRAGR